MKKSLANTFYLSILMLGLSQLGMAQQVVDEVKSQWKGFERIDFKFENKEAHVVKPLKALNGNPWVWRASFPDWHADMDSLLLSEGFHIVFINTVNQFGSPRAVETWNNYYTYLLRTFNLNKKVSIEAVSRGGLQAYAWVKKHPELINCIYAEAPVCDFTSWPGGFGKGKGSKEDWDLLKIELGFSSDGEAKAWSDHACDHLEALAAAKVPLMHMIGLNDEVVPVDENSNKLIDRYIRLGGPATVVPCTRGKQDLLGHHFPIETPRLGADFIKYNSSLSLEPINSLKYIQLRAGIRNSLLKFQREKKGRVAFLGGSITYNSGWRDSICNYLKTRFPETTFEFIAAGIPSMGSTPHAFRLQNDVLSKGNIDLLFLEAAVNDQANQFSSEEQICAMEGIVRHVRKTNSLTDLVLLHFVDPEKMEMYRKGEVPPVIQNHEKVAGTYKLASINHAKEVTDRIDAGEFSWENDFKNLHPSPFGQQVYWRSIKALLQKAWSGSVAEDDKLESYALPPCIDQSCYDNGCLVEINHVAKTGNWKLVDAWKPIDGKETRANYGNVPMLIGDDKSGELSFNFKGNAVGVAVAAGPDAGIIEYRIDKAKWQKQDLFTKWSSYLHLPWFYTLASGLKSGAHTLCIRLTTAKNEQSTGNCCRIRYFYVNGEGISK